MLHAWVIRYMILKIQRPLEQSPLDGEPFALVYNESRSYIANVLLSDVEKWFVKDDLKVYVKAKLSKREGIATIPQAENILFNFAQGSVIEAEPNRFKLNILRRVKKHPW